MRHRQIAVVLASVAVLVSTTSAQGPTFFDASVGWGVTVHRDSPYGKDLGFGDGGSAFLDYDADGDEDLFVPSPDGRHRLFHNVGGSFEESVVTAASVAGNPRNVGVTVGDYNNDGYPDIYLTNKGPNNLLTNLGDGTFRDDTTEVGLTGSFWSTSAAWADFDRDGDLDLYVCNYIGVEAWPYHLGQPNNLYVNVGSSEAPHFEDQGEQCNVWDLGQFGEAHPDFPYSDGPDGRQPGQPVFGAGLSVSTRDYDDDGDQDILVGNDFGMFVSPNRLYRNDTPKGGAMTFTDVSSLTLFSSHPHFNMGISGADYDHDGDWDFYLSNMGPNILFRNDSGTYSDVSAAAGVVAGEMPDASEASGTSMLTSWASVWCDFDNDLWEDLYLVNGHMPSEMPNPLREPNLLFHNKGDGTFDTVSPEKSGAADDGGGRSVALADVNHDGLMDFFLVNLTSSTIDAAKFGESTDISRLFLNKGTLSTADNHWLELRLKGRVSNQEGIGSRVDAMIGPHKLRRQVLADPLYVSSSTRMVHFGAGPFETADSVTIDWPSGIHQELVKLPNDFHYRIQEPSVLMPEHRQPSYTGSHVDFSARIENLTTTDTEATVFWLLHLGENDPAVAYLSKTLVVPAGQTIDATVSIPVPASSVGSLSSMVLDQRTYVFAAGALDSRRDVFGIDIAGS